MASEVKSNMIAEKKKLRKILDDKTKNENHCQKFLEENPDLMIYDFLLNHHIHFNSIISKFPLDTSLVSDFVFLTKSSNKWRIVFVELENQHKKLFTNNKRQITPTADFTFALSQIHSWCDFIKKNGTEIVRKLDPFRVPMSKNSYEFKFVLIVGRDGDIKNNQAMRDRLVTYEKDDLIIHTYDSLLRYEKNFVSSTPNILSLSKNSYTFKQLHSEPESLFAYLSTEHFLLSRKDRALLVSWGYDIDSWDKGKPLIYNDKYVSFKDAKKAI